MTIFVDTGVTSEHNCKFNGACYGEICINNELCLKKDEDLTEEEKEHIKQFNEQMKTL